MKTVRIEPRYSAWRDEARRLLAQGVLPDSIIWEDEGSEIESLFGGLDSDTVPTPAGPLKIPRQFLELAELVACHSHPERWALLYRTVWRLTKGSEKHLLQIMSDRDVNRLNDFASAVRRDRHKMKAFVRFRKIGLDEESGREQFVAWFEPDHHIVELTAPFFAKRFASMDWSILTPDQCVHWNGRKLEFTAGVSKKEAPDSDALDDYWRTYYSHIFNPARLKLKAMQSEMPKKYWKNLPEAPLIAELTSQASLRTGEMVEAPSSQRAHVSERIPAGVPKPAPKPIQVNPVEVLRQADTLKLSEIHDQADHCRACQLHDRATQLVFGVGPETANLMIVGEQPGDQEDLQGLPFVGPAGKLLDEALSEVGIDRSQTYVTNAVKHFKWKRREKRRIHQSPSADEVHVCRPWVLAEVLKVRPKVLICLGATAAKSLIRSDFRLLEERGTVEGCELAERVIATIHPSYLLRIRDSTQHQTERAAWIGDLKLALVA
ncbi:MAG: UdgX family uracil-DNA binding protein [Verrucomicrobiota bacterium]